MAGYWDDPHFVDELDLTEHTGVLLAEDAALKFYLSGLSVPDRDGASEVDVWFRWPSSERRIQYPFITIDFLNIVPSYERWTSIWQYDPNNEAIFCDSVTGEEKSRGLYTPSVAPDLGFDTSLEDGSGARVDNYLMHKLIYQVTVHCRSAMHDRWLASRFITNIFPPRPFFIPVDADSTWRRAELLQSTAADTIETTDSGSKRIFKKVYTVSIDAELLQSQIVEIERVLRLHVDIYGDVDGDREAADHPYDAEHDVALSELTVTPPPGP